MSDSTTDKAVFTFLAGCVGDFVRWPQCKSVDLWSNINDYRLSGVRFEVRATNPVDRTSFKIIVTNNGDWRVRIIQLLNHIWLDECDADRDLIVHAVNRFRELAGMAAGQES